eukprot:c37370_g1_i1 orf=134-334(-)
MVVYQLHCKSLNRLLIPFLRVRLRSLPVFRKISPALFMDEEAPLFITPGPSPSSTVKVIPVGQGSM